MPFPRTPLPLALAALALLHAPARADDPAPAAPTPPASNDWSAHLSLEDLLDIELAAPAKVPMTARQAPGIVSVVTRPQAREYGWSTLNDILFAQPGFFVSHDYERTTVGARGLFESWNSNHLLLLVDGVPFNETQAGGALTGEMTPLFLMKSVEVVRGPGSALYGSSATNGVVAVNTISSARNIDDANELSANSEALLRAGTGGTGALDVVTVARSPHVSTVLGFSTSHTDGTEYPDYDGSGRRDASGALQKFRVWDARTTRYLFAKLDGRGSLEGLQLQYHLQDWDYSTGHGWIFWSPDFDLPMRSQRHIAVLSYRSPAEAKVTQEYVLKFERQQFEQNMRFLPNGAYDGAYPAGITEQVQSHLGQGFARAQLSGRPWEHVSLLGGAEYSADLYDGDDLHVANADLSKPDAPPTKSFVTLGSFYEPIVGRPVHTLGTFAQLALERLGGLPLYLTAGARFDLKRASYLAVAAPGTPERSKAFDQFSPRIALVWSPAPTFSMKAAAGQAFRAPSTVELFGMNTWAVASNVDALQPERITTSELAADWSVTKHVTWRTTAFASRFEDQIGYGSGNLSVNLYSRDLAGLESELLFEASLGSAGAVNGFASWSHVNLLKETVPDPKITAESFLTWAPTDTGKAGASWRLGAWNVAAQGLFQGGVRRRTSDALTAENAALRGASVPWFTRFDVNARYRVTPELTVGVQVKNLLDSPIVIVKPGDSPFDYRLEGRRVAGTLELAL